VLADSRRGIGGIAEVKKNSNGEVNIRLNNGKTLNEMLPVAFTIRNEKNLRPQMRMSTHTIEVNEEKLRNPFYLGTVAHEFGHLIDKRQDKLVGQEIDAEYILLTKSNMSSNKKVETLTKIFRLKMQVEINASDTGKIIADMLGVDDSIYEDVITDGLKSHYSAELHSLGSKILRNCPDISERESLTIFDPFSQTDRTYTYGELKEEIGKMEKMNNQAIRDLDHKIGIS
jgi:hypothetical protein